jgi:hypothetical protein
VAREVLVPVLLDELKELEVVLHLALDQRLHPDGLVDLVFGEGICVVSVRVRSVRCRAIEAGKEGCVLCNTLKFCRYAYSVLALNLTRDIGTSSASLLVATDFC